MSTRKHYLGQIYFLIHFSCNKNVFWPHLGQLNLYEIEGFSKVDMKIHVFKLTDNHLGQVSNRFQMAQIGARSVLHIMNDK